MVALAEKRGFLGVEICAKMGENGAAPGRRWRAVDAGQEMNCMGEEMRENQQEELAQPGGSFPIQMLFREETPLADMARMEAVLGQHCGKVECFGQKDGMVGFRAMEHLVELDGEVLPVQLIMVGGLAFEGDKIPVKTVQQMWDCVERREEILSQCRYQVLAHDMLAGALPMQERARLDMDFLEALAELYPSCEAFYFPTCGKLLPGEAVRHHDFKDLVRFVHFGMNVRCFKMGDEGDVLMDTLGLGVLELPDLQYHFRGVSPDWVAEHACTLAAYLLEHENPISAGQTVDGLDEGGSLGAAQWLCQYEEAIVHPPREVLDIEMGPYAAGNRGPDFPSPIQTLRDIFRERD